MFYLVELKSLVQFSFKSACQCQMNNKNISLKKEKDTLLTEKILKIRLYVYKSIHYDNDKCLPGEGGVDAVDETVVHYRQDSHTPSINYVSFDQNILRQVENKYVNLTDYNLFLLP